ncbi:MAG: hypothetical protein IPK84_00885 [Candidatus Moraniibacteriota bacterium]|nr:MAG: hypothetical protein IPK84_00885 [Candidatus Moranbacteria bacterium]
MPMIFDASDIAHNSRKPSLFRRGTAAAFFYASLVLAVPLWCLPVFFIGVGNSTTVLRYNAYFGVDLTGASWQTLFVPAVTTFFFFVNTILAFLFVRRGVPVFGTLLMVASFFLQVAALIVVSALILVN